jgi:hypothetical protein
MTYQGTVHNDGYSKVASKNRVSMARLYNYHICLSKSNKNGVTEWVDKCQRRMDYI